MITREICADVGKQTEDCDENKTALHCRAVLLDIPAQNRMHFMAVTALREPGESPGFANNLPDSIP